MASIRVLLVDDHEVVRIGLRTLLEMEPDIRVVGEAADGDAALREARAAHPQVVVMDVRMGPTDGIQACRKIKSELPDVGVLMLTSFGTEEAVLASLLAGASGFLLKNTGRSDAREREVLALVAQGLTNKQIAERLVVAETTARNHVSHILDRLGMHRRSEAAALAAQVGLTAEPNR